MHPGFTPDGPATGLFPSTRWSLIIQAAAPATPQAREALERALLAVLAPRLRLHPPQG